MTLFNQAVSLIDHPNLPQPSPPPPLLRQEGWRSSWRRAMSSPTRRSPTSLCRRWWGTPGGWWSGCWAVFPSSACRAASTPTKGTRCGRWAAVLVVMFVARAGDFLTSFSLFGFVFLFSLIFFYFFGVVFFCGFIFFGFVFFFGYILIRLVVFFFIILVSTLFSTMDAIIFFLFFFFCLLLKCFPSSIVYFYQSSCFLLFLLWMRLLKALSSCLVFPHTSLLSNLLSIQYISDYFCFVLFSLAFLYQTVNLSLRLPLYGISHFLVSFLFSYFFPCTPNSTLTLSSPLSGPTAVRHACARYEGNGRGATRGDQRGGRPQREL